MNKTVGSRGRIMLPRCKAHTKSGIDVGDCLVHGHVYEPPAQAEVREQQQHGPYPPLTSDQRPGDPKQKKTPDFEPDLTNAWRSFYLFSPSVYHTL